MKEMTERKVSGWSLHGGREEEAREAHSPPGVHRKGQEERWDVGSHMTGLDLGRHTEEESSCPVFLYLNTEPEVLFVGGYETFETWLA